MDKHNLEERLINFAVLIVETAQKNMQNKNRKS